jgi:hypothetical protein
MGSPPRRPAGGDSVVLAPRFLRTLAKIGRRVRRWSMRAMFATK